MNTNSTEIPLFDLYDLWYEPLWHKPWFWWLIGGIGLLMVTLVIFLFIRKIKLSKRHAPKEPWELALEQLQHMRVCEYEHAERHAEFYSKLTQILKIYLNYRYELSLESKTDQEVIEMLGSSEFPKEFLREISLIFQGALYIKFAHKYAISQRMNSDLEQSINIINQTNPQQKSSKNIST